MNPLILLIGLAMAGRKRSSSASSTRAPTTRRPEPTVEVERPTSSATPASSTPTTPAEVLDARAAVDAVLRAPTPPKLTPRETARALALHLRKTHSFGTKAKPDPIVAQAQRDLDVSPADGIVGPATRAAARRAGVTLPLRG